MNNLGSKIYNMIRFLLTLIFASAGYPYMPLDNVLFFILYLLMIFSAADVVALVLMHFGNLHVGIGTYLRVLFGTLVKTALIVLLFFYAPTYVFNQIDVLGYLGIPLNLYFVGVVGVTSFITSFMIRLRPRIILT